MYQSSSRPTSTIRVVEMMPWWRRWGWSVRHQKRTVHIIFGNTSFFIGATSALCSTKNMLQSINIFIANSQLSIIIYYTAKNRAPKFYAGLLQIFCWEPAGSHLSKLVATPVGTHLYSVARPQMPTLKNSSRSSKTGSLDWECAILLLSYVSLHNRYVIHCST